MNLRETRRHGNHTSATCRYRALPAPAVRRREADQTAGGQRRALRGRASLRMARPFKAVRQTEHSSTSACAGGARCACAVTQGGAQRYAEIVLAAAARPGASGPAYPRVRYGDAQGGAAGPQRAGVRASGPGQSLMAGGPYAPEPRSPAEVSVPVRIGIGIRIGNAPTAQPIRTFQATSGGIRLMPGVASGPSRAGAPKAVEAKCGIPGRDCSRENAAGQPDLRSPRLPR